MTKHGFKAAALHGIRRLNIRSRTNQRRVFSFSTNGFSVVFDDRSANVFLFVFFKLSNVFRGHRSAVNCRIFFFNRRFQNAVQIFNGFLLKLNSFFELCMSLFCAVRVFNQTVNIRQRNVRALYQIVNVPSRQFVIAKRKNVTGNFYAAAIAHVGHARFNGFSRNGALTPCSNYASGSRDKCTSSGDNAKISNICRSWHQRDFVSKSRLSSHAIRVKTSHHAAASYCIHVSCVFGKGIPFFVHSARSHDLGAKHKHSQKSFCGNCSCFFSVLRRNKRIDVLRNNALSLADCFSFLQLFFCAFFALCF